MLAQDFALLTRLGFPANFPFARGLALDICGHGVANNFRTQLACTCRQAKANAGGIGVTIFGGVQGTDHAIEVIEWMHLGDKVRANKLHWETQRAANANGMAQPIHFIFGVRQTEAAATMPGHALPGLSFKLAVVKIDVIAHAFAQRVAAG